jgi:hypothetical protein
MVIRSSSVSKFGVFGAFELALLTEANRSRASRPPNSRKQRDQQLEPLRAEQRKALEKRGAVQARDRIRSATARKFTQQIIDTIMVNS